MERILFIVPPYIKFDDFVNPSHNARLMRKKTGNYSNVFTDMPLGIISMSAYIKKHTPIEAKIIDFNVDLNTMESFLFDNFIEYFGSALSESKWIDFSPTIICISALVSSGYQNVIDIAKCCRNTFPNAIIVAGGGVPTNMHKKIFNDSTSFDALCFGEGEKPLLELVTASDKLAIFEKNPSWINRKKSDANESFQFDFIENLDEIPFYDYELLDIPKYSISPNISTYTSITDKTKTIPVMMSRGCTHRCCFCSSHTVHGRKLRYHSTDRVREDIARLKYTYGIDTIVFYDDHFMADKKRAHEIVHILIELQLKPFFANSLALYALDKSFLEALKTAGINQLVLSVESGSQRVLRELMHKPLNLDIVKRVINDCKDLGISRDVNILIGLPGETKQDIQDTRIFLKKIDATWIRIVVATPVVGSEMLKICLEKNYIKGNYMDCDFKKAIVETEEFSTEYIQEIAYVMNLEINFVENSDMRNGNYALALEGFENAIRAKDDHAIAYYYAAQCYEKLGNTEKATSYLNLAKDIFTEKPFWQNYSTIFNLPV